MEKYIKTYFENKEEVSAVFLFGSYAKGKPQRNSDVDIAVLFGISGRGMIYDTLERYHIELSRLLRKDLHLVVLNFVGEMLLLQIFKTGKCILVNNRKKLAEFRIAAFSRIFDFNYHRDKMRTGLIRKVVHGRS